MNSTVHAGEAISPAAQSTASGESEDRFRSLLRFSSDWYWEQDENFRFTANLRGFPERPGIRNPSYVGKTRWEMPCHRVSEAQWQAHRAALLAHQPFIDFEYLRPSADGRMRWVSVSGEPVFDAQGRFRGYRGIGRDITEHKQTRQRQAIEHAVAQSLADADVLSEAVPSIIESICQTMGWDYGACWQQAAPGQPYTRAQMWCHEPLRDSEFAARTRAKRIEPANQGLVRHVLATGEPRWITDIAADSGLERRVAALGCGLTGAFAFPISTGNRILGAMEFFAKQIWPPDLALADIAPFVGRQIARFMVRKETEARLALMAQYDGLTGLPNRSLFLDRLHQAMARARRSGTMVGLMFFDLDHFKPINDTLGHSTGDRVLQAVATRLKEQLREVDTISRLGGDEFTLIVEGVSSSARLVTIARKVRDAIAAPMVIDGREHTVTASIGVTVFPRDGSEVDELLKHADVAMYRAKQDGRNTHRFYRAEMAVSPSGRP